MSDKQSIEPKQTFVPLSDRPEVKLIPEVPLSELRVRDLDVILGEQIVTPQGLGELYDRVKNKPVIYRHIAKTSAELLYEITLSASTHRSDLQQVIEAILALEQRVNALAPQLITSKNWSGARLIKAGPHLGNPDDPPGGAFRSVWATWTLPQVKPPSAAVGAGKWYSASWVGLGGGGAWKETAGEPPADRSSADVLQAGFSHDVSRDANGVLTFSYQAWYAWDPGLEPDASYDSRFQKANITVVAGDVVFVKVEFIRSDCEALIKFTNHTQNTTCSVRIPIPATHGASVDLYRGDTIEWVLERPFDGQHQKYYELADYKAIDFISAAGETYAGSTVIPEQGKTINMPNSEATIISSHTLHIEYKP